MNVVHVICYTDKTELDFLWASAVWQLIPAINLVYDSSDVWIRIRSINKPKI